MGLFSSSSKSSVVNRTEVFQTDRRIGAEGSLIAAEGSSVTLTDAAAIESAADLSEGVVGFAADVSRDVVGFAADIAKGAQTNALAIQEAALSTVDPSGQASRELTRAVIPIALVIGGVLIFTRWGRA